MKTINVYGSGCRNCAVTAERLTQEASARNLDVQVEKVTDLEAIMQAGVVSTPAVGMDGQLMHSGSVPTDEQVKQILDNV